MEVYRMVVLGLVMGLAFGFALEKGRVFEPGVIVGQMQLRTFTMLKMFLSAVATGLIVLAVLNGVYGVPMHPKATLYAAEGIGGLLLGIGITLAGACPGTLLAQIGAGYKDAWFALAGAIAGAVAFGYAEPVLKPLLLSGGPGKTTLDGLLGLPFWIVAIGLAVPIVVGLVFLEHYRPWRADLGPDADGLPE